MDNTQNSKVGAGKKKGKNRETLEAILIAVAIALCLRAFVVEAFKIPSSSMVPNLKIGDHIFVNKFTYGLRIPFTLTQLAKMKQPKRGEIIIFNYPGNTSLDYIKRLVGLPGDRIKIEDNKVWINGNLLQREDITDSETLGLLKDIPNSEEYSLFREKSADEIPYIVMYRKYRPGMVDCNYCSGARTEDTPNGVTEDLIVPEGMYFAMGDNRDNSSDSRVWGFVPAAFVKGRALFTWLSLNSDEPLFWKVPSIRWERFGRLIR